MDSPTRKTFDTRNPYVHWSTKNSITLVYVSHHIESSTLISIVEKSEGDKHRWDLHQWNHEQRNKWFWHYTLTQNLKALGLWVFPPICCLICPFLFNVRLYLHIWTPTISPSSVSLFYMVAPLQAKILFNPWVSNGGACRAYYFSTLHCRSSLLAHNNRTCRLTSMYGSTAMKTFDTRDLHA